MKHWRMYCLSFVFLISFLGFYPSVHGAEGLPEGVIIGDDSGLKVGEDGKYFIEHTDIRPGLVFEKKISISNYSQTPGVFRLQLEMKRDKTSGEIDLMEAIQVTLKQDGKSIYTGDLTGNGKQVIDLGNFKTGQQGTLDATFTVRDIFPKEQWRKKNSADFHWIFYGTNETESTNSKPKKVLVLPLIGKLPQTGEDMRNVLMGIIIGLLLIILVLVIRKKRQE